MAITALSEFSYTGIKGVNLITLIGRTEAGFEEFKASPSGLGIDIAYNADATAAVITSNYFTIKIGRVYRAVFTIVLHDGNYPLVNISVASVIKSNTVTTVEGLNIVYFTVTKSSSKGYIRIRDVLGTKFSMSDIDVREAATSDLLSPFMNPVLYFSVSGASGVTSPTAEIEFDGTTEDVTIEATFLETVSTVHYFSVDLSDLMKYMIKEFDGGNYPDDLEFINGSLLQMFDEYFRELVMDVFFERGTGDEQTAELTNTWLYLANQMPYIGGFNLLNVFNLDSMKPLKWGSDTYNSIFFYHDGGEVRLFNNTKDRHVLNLFDSWANLSGTVTAYTANGLDLVAALSPAGFNYLYAYKGSYERHYPSKAGDVITVILTAVLTAGAAPKIYIIEEGEADGSLIDIAAGVNTLTHTVTTDINIFVRISYADDSVFTLSKVSILGFFMDAGYYQYKFSKEIPNLNTGLNDLILTAGLQETDIAIDFHPDCPEIPVCWQHPLLGYVSYPFNGNKVTNVSGSKISEISKFVTSMQSVNTLKEVTGLNETKRIVLTTKADEQYFELLQTIYSSRHVYLFIGESGDEDSSQTWIECEVSGSGSSRSDRVKGTFQVELLLPEQFNIKY
jgi:hypothetical protein